MLVNYLAKKGDATDIPKKKDTLISKLTPRLSKIEQQYGGDKNYVTEMAETFLSQIKSELTELDACFADHNYLKMAKVAHSMKSTVSYMELHHEIGHLLVKIEKQESTDAADGIIQNIEAIKLFCYDVIAEIETELRIYKASGQVDL